jgi:CheY-like chemotaxis protein
VNKEMRILLVDDSLLMRLRVEDLLRGIGFSKIRLADDGRAALAELGKARFDFVITDSIMPQVGGPELIRRIRSDPETADLPTLMMTAEAGIEQMRLARKLGANGTIYKPFSSTELERKIEEIFALIECAV